jgi:hypothetical protein
MTIKECSETSPHKGDSRYVCNIETGRFNLSKGYKRATLANAPKRPKTSYMLWCTTPGVRENIMKLLRSEGKPPTLTMVGIKFGELWNSGKWPNGQIIDKKHYAQLAEPDQVKYKVLSSKFKGKDKDKGFTEVIPKPKHPRGRTLYNKFYHDYRMKLIRARPELSIPGHGKELNTLISKEWAKQQVKEKSKTEYSKPAQKRKDHSIIQPSE